MQLSLVEVDGTLLYPDLLPTKCTTSLSVDYRMNGLWYHVNADGEGDELPPTAHLKFLYGDVLEVMLLSLAMAAGHDVLGCQDELSLAGIIGHRDCVIDGVTVDVKSASPFSFSKFNDGTLRDNDAFGYISQLRAYIRAGRDFPEGPEVHPTRGAFLVIDKVSGELCLDVHDFTEEEIDELPDEFDRTKALVYADTPPPRGFEPLEDGYKAKGVFKPNGNLYLGVNCSYCEFKKKCWPGLRTFMYKGGNGYKPKFFTHVAKEPNVLEATND